MRAACILCMLAAPALAEAPLDARTFDALTQGRTMTWAEFGTIYGVEQYLPGRRVRWTVLGDECMAGHWYAEDAAICFQYDHRPDPVCWQITTAGKGLHAQLVGAAAGVAPVVIEETREPLACFGPEVGA